MKSTILAYFLWLFGGWWGIHLFYLGRDRHAFVWFITWGGIFGAGWLRDLFRIPDYVDEANDDPEYKKYIKRQQLSWRMPPFNSVRFVGELAVGMLFGTLVLSTVPQEYYEEYPVFVFLHFLSAMSVSAGVHLVGCIGQEKVSYWVSFAAASVPTCMNLITGSSNLTSNLTSSALFSALTVNFLGKKWRAREKSRHVCSRIFILSIAVMIYSSMWGLCLYHNTYIITNDGHKVKMKVAVENFFNSPAWENMKGSMAHVFDTFMNKGLWEAFDEFRLLIDPEGETNSYRVLGLSSRSSQQEITQAYRSLVRKWHPDRHQDPKEKENAEKEFLKIQKAYETISEIHNRRAGKD